MQANYQASCDLPPELCAKPLALIGISGLDTLNNAIHKSIWEAFNSLKRTDKSSVVYKLIENDHEFPIIKPKRNSYDWYVPKGIIKKNWMRKHLYEIPAVMAIFYELDWNEPSWTEKMIECASRIQSMRAALDGRNTRILLVLIQNALPLPPGEDVQATERAVSICASCELQSNSLFVLPQGDHLHGYALRLESAFLEFAQNFYHNEIRNVKSHKEHLNKVSHQYLFVRHQFKLGFLYELKQDIHTAHKHYTHSYNTLLEIRVVDTNALEIRSIAGFINYKLCRLLFALNLPRDAIAHFKAHVDKFRQRIGFQELAFEHFAWLSKQFAVFGDVFDAAVKLGITPVQTQHPGIYYQQAAEYSIMRKTFAFEVCSKVTSYPICDPFDISQHVDFYGQRHWKSSKSGIEPLDPDLESRGIQALQFLEKQVNHSNIIIGLYGLAIQQHKIYKCPRMRRYLVIQMADEYYKAGDFGKCSTLLMHMLYDMRCEKWWKLITDILVRAFQCAYLTANVSDYLSLAIELISRSTNMGYEEKKIIYDNIERVMTLQIPYGDSTLQHDILQNAILQWQTVFCKAPINISLDMSNIFPCIETDAKFTKSSFEMGENVVINVTIKNTSQFDLTFCNICVIINASTTVQEIPIEGVDFNFKSGDSKNFSVESELKHEYVHKTLQISSVNLIMGDLKVCSLEMKFTNYSHENGSLTDVPHFQYTEGMTNNLSLHPLSKTIIQPRKSKLNINFEHDSPALQNEWYEIRVIINNDEACTLDNLNIELSVPEDRHIDGLEFATRPSGNIQKLPLLLGEYGTFTDKTTSVKFYVRANRVLQQSIQIKTTYVPSDNPSLVCTKVETSTFEVIIPFQITTKFFSTFMIELTEFHYNEPFKIACVMESLSPWPIVFESSEMEFDDYQVKNSDCGDSNRVVKTILNKNETYVDMFPVIPTYTSEQNINIGKYTMKWKRKNGYSATNHVTITGFPVHWVPLRLSVDVAAYGIVRQPLLIAYNVINNSNQLIQLTVNMEACDGFMFSGYKQFTVSVLPNSSRAIKYNLYPLITGRVTLPKVVMKIPEGEDDDIDVLLKQEELDSLVKRSLPFSLYVIPQTKGAPPMQTVEVKDDMTEEVELNILEDI